MKTFDPKYLPTLRREALNDHIDLAAEVARDETERDTDDDGDHERHDAAPRSPPCAVHEAREEVTTELVGTQEVAFGSRSSEDAEQVLLLRVRAGEQSREDRSECDDQQPSSRDDCRRFAQQPLSEAPLRNALLGEWAGHRTRTLGSRNE